MSSALNPHGGGGGDMAGLHLMTIRAAAADYRAANELLRHGFWRSRVVRRKIFLGKFLLAFGWGAAAAVLTLAWRMASRMQEGLSLSEGLRWVAGLLPLALVLVIAISAVITAVIAAFFAWYMRRFRRIQERKADAAPMATLAWNSARFGVVIDGTLHAWPIAELLAWEETDRHLFLVTREAEVLIPIPRDQADPAALAVLRDALAEADLPGLWAYAERELLRRLDPEYRWGELGSD